MTFHKTGVRPTFVAAEAAKVGTDAMTTSFNGVAVAPSWAAGLVRYGGVALSVVQHTCIEKHGNDLALDSIATSLRP